jgi:hypothetical protein
MESNPALKLLACLETMHEDYFDSSVLPTIEIERASSTPTTPSNRQKRPSSELETDPDALGHKKSSSRGRGRARGRRPRRGA